MGGGGDTRLAAAGLLCRTFCVVGGDEVQQEAAGHRRDEMKEGRGKKRPNGWKAEDRVNRNERNPVPF